MLSWDFLLFSGFPSFAIYPSPQTVVNGSLITLDCRAIGQPPPVVSWFKNFEALNLTADSGIEVEENGTLFIRDADFDDSGFYTCMADNGLGINQVSVAVEVIPLLQITQNKTGEYIIPG